MVGEVALFLYVEPLQTADSQGNEDHTDDMVGDGDQDQATLILNAPDEEHACRDNGHDIENKCTLNKS